MYSAVRSAGIKSGCGECLWEARATKASQHASMPNKTVFSVYKGGKGRRLAARTCMQVRTRACMHASGLHAGVCGVCEGAQKGIARAHTVLEYPCRTARLLPRMLHTHARARSPKPPARSSSHLSSRSGGAVDDFAFLRRWAVGHLDGTRPPCNQDPPASISCMVSPPI